MKKGILLLVVTAWSVTMSAQSKSPKLLGACTPDDLKQEPYAEWFTKNYTDYVPNEGVINQLKSMDMNYQVAVFFGTWCEDSQREVPRLLKTLDAVGFSQSALQLIAVGNESPLNRQSPNHEERGKHIYRVPTIIISQNGNELNRFIEFPVMSVERDLLAILKQEYSPNFPLYLFLASWLDKGILDDINVSHKGLADQIRETIHSANELNGFANLLSQRDSSRLEAVSKVLQMNCYLYPEVYWTYTKLAEALSKEGRHEQAIEILQEGLSEITDSNNQQRMQELLDAILNKME